MNKLITICTVSVLFGIGSTATQADPIVLSYHSSTINGTMTTYIYGTTYAYAVKYDLPNPTKQYGVISLGIVSQGRTTYTVFPANTKIVVRVWDANGLPLYTSDVFDWSGESCALALRTMYIDTAHIRVSGSFYAGFQTAPGVTGGEFGYKVDLPSGNQFGHSFRYKNSDGTWSTYAEDFMFDVTVDIVPDYTISGYTLEPDGTTPIAGVLMDANSNVGNPDVNYAVSDANGYYEVKVPYGWSGKVVPTKYAYGFEPNSRQYFNVNSNQSDQDYSGRLLTFAISGYIKNDCNVPIADVLVDANEGGGEAITDVNGFYEVWVDYNWSGTVTPTKKNYTFDPNWRPYTNVLDDMIDQNYTATNIFDLDCDGVIGLGDIGVFSDNWLVTGENVQGDIYKDENNIVNFLDFSMFAKVWQGN